MSAWLIKKVRPLGADAVDVLIRDGVIEQISESIDAADATVIDAEGMVGLPGLVDLHTHLREPGREDAETIETGSRAAALGGYTAVFAMANTEPVADTAGVVEQVYNTGKQIGLVDVYPIGAVTVGLKGEQLAELGAMAESTAKVRIFSDDGMCVNDPALMRRALEYVKAFDGIIAQHAEDARLTQGAQMNESELSGKLGLTGWPRVAEESIIARDCLLAQHVGSRVHICHLSTEGSVEIVRWAKSRGINVTAEVTPHHLLLSEELVATYDPVYKVNPPLRGPSDNDALRAALRDGTIDIVATDHAPHAVEDKECEWAYARPGMLGLQQALSITILTLSDESGHVDWEAVARVTSVAPATIAGLTDHGRGFEVGAPANLAIVDPRASTVVDRSALASKSHNTPYEGLELPGKVITTILHGEPTVLDGQAVK